jgi:hypothetical protein
MRKLGYSKGEGEEAKEGDKMGLKEGMQVDRDSPRKRVAGLQLQLLTSSLLGRI